MARTASKRHSFRVEPEILRAPVAVLANDHIEQNHAVFFAQNSVGFACDRLITMSTKNLHGQALKQLEDQQRIGAQLLSNGKEFSEVSWAVPIGRKISLRAVSLSVYPSGTLE